MEPDEVIALVELLLKLNEVERPAIVGLLDIERDLLRARRTAALDGTTVEHEALILASSRIRGLSQAKRIEAAVELATTKELSQREVQHLTGVSRDTIRKHQQASQSSGRKPARGR